MEAAGKLPIHSLQSDCYLPNRFAVRPETRDLDSSRIDKKKRSLALWLKMLTWAVHGHV